MIYLYLRDIINSMKTLGALLLLIFVLIITACDGGLNQPGLNLLPDADASPDGRIADHSVINELRLGRISEAKIQAAKEKLHIAYGHTSHGSQITTGMSGLTAFANGGGLKTDYSADLFSYNAGGSGGALDLREGGGYSSGHLELDAGYYPSWVNETQDFLNDSDYNSYNVIMWSWCGQVSGKSEQAMIDEYLEPMSAFEAAHPEIVFIYMTGHLDGTGEEGNLHLRNEQIRDYCSANNKWLFDFADIETHDPDGESYMALNVNDACDYNGGNWAAEWQARHTEDLDWYSCSSAHSQPLNANMKAYAAWWIFSEIAAQM